MRLRAHPPILSDRDPLPDAETASPEGLVAVGGGLSVERLREAYSKGMFPWSSAPPTWWSPDPRAILPLNGLRLPRRLAQKIRQGRFQVTFDRAFDDVIGECARQPRRGETTWISPGLVAAYRALHRAGDAHSAEAWSADGRLAGGIYGVASGGAFAGESMFHTETDASKIALHALIERLRECGFVLFDAQVINPFTRQMGAVEIPRREFLERLQRAREVQPTAALGDVR